MSKKNRVMGWLVLAGFFICASRLYNSTSKGKKELQENCLGQQENSIAQPVELERKQVDVGQVSIRWIIIYGLLIWAITSAVLSLEIKRAADFAGIFVLFLATLILALQPESTSGEKEGRLAAKQKKHIYTAIALVVFGTIMQFSSFDLSRREASEAENRIRQLDRRLEYLEKANAVQADTLAHAESEIKRMKEATKNNRVNQLPASIGVSRSVHSRQEGKLRQEIQK